MSPQHRILHPVDGGPEVHAWDHGVPMEPDVWTQVKHLASVPGVERIAIMPDAHIGKGACVGSAILTRDIVIPSSVGVDIGCFHGDTRVPLLDGTQQTLRGLASREVPFWVYSADISGRVVPGRARALLTRHNAPLVKVVISGGDEIVCTPDHQFLLTDGSYRAAAELRFNTGLMPLYRRWQSRDGYESVSARYRTARMTQELVYEAVNGPIPAGSVVHHINHNHFDNRPENLELMTASEHSAHHRRNGRRFDNADPEFQKLRLAGIRRAMADPEILARKRDIATRNITNYMLQRPEHFAKAVAGNGKRGANTLRLFNTRPRVCPDCGEEQRNPSALQWHRRREHGYKERRLPVRYNHKVLSVTPLDETADVYCLQVEEHHNFALAAGIFVHNCGMIAAPLRLKRSDLKDLHRARAEIEKRVPVGRTNRGQAGDRGAWGTPPEDVVATWKHELLDDYRHMTKKWSELDHPFTIHQFGTLGTGNHFIEVCIQVDDPADEDPRIWVMLHSGSRGIGNKIGTFFMRKAQAETQRLHIKLPDPELGFLRIGTDLAEDYMTFAAWAQRYAWQNRVLMFRHVLSGVGAALGLSPADDLAIASEIVHCRHNYIARETHFGAPGLLTRKGAVNAAKGVMGIIPGCFAANTRILMSNGLYKDISAVLPGERVIVGNGSSARVQRVLSQGLRKTWGYRNNTFHAETRVTPDHLHLIGDLSTADYQRTGRVKILNRRTRAGASKLEWCAIESLPSSFMLLLPKTMHFADMPAQFSETVDGIEIRSSYALGYTLATYLGDGSAYYAKSDGGQVTWAFGLGEQHIASKLVEMIRQSLKLEAKTYRNARNIVIVVHRAALARILLAFGKRDCKAIPERFWCADPDYILGLYDGFIDSDGHVNNETKKFTNTSPALLEQFAIIHYLLFGYMPSVSRREPAVGGLPRCNLENCKPSYRATSLRLPPIAREHLVVEMLSLDKTERTEEVYDIEVEGNEHSFIANNAIVHNSMGARSYITRGLGNPDSLNTSSHGAGRVMSRHAARKAITLEQHLASLAGVECRTDADVIDESPAAYKDIDSVMAAQSDLTEPVHTLKQIIVVKG